MPSPTSVTKPPPRLARYSRQVGSLAARNLTSWAVVGSIVALTGFGPEHWFAAVFQYLEAHQVGLTPPRWLDVRTVIVLIGVAIVVSSVLLRRMQLESDGADAAILDAPPQRADADETPAFEPHIEASATAGATRPVLASPDAVAPAVPDRPSIVVLPFDNMSGDSGQDYFSDGITEDIITDLSKVAGLFVIARNSAFAYKNTAVNVSQICRDLGVRFALEGSIRRSGNKVRVTAQLIDGSTGGHIWAERYDRDLTDIFDVQDDVTRQIVSALKVTLSEAEISGLDRGGTRNVEAHDAILRGRDFMSIKKDRAHYHRWMACFRRAIELDPDYSDAYACLSLGYFIDHQNRWSEHPELSLGEAERNADEAIARNDRNPLAHFAATLAAQGRKDYVRWAAETERALSLNPNFAPAIVSLGNFHVYTGEPLKGLAYIQRAMRLDPTMRGQYLHFLGTAYFAAGDYRTAAEMFEDRIKIDPDTDLSRALLVSALGHLGQVEQARRIWRELMAINPAYSLQGHAERLPFKNPADAARIGEGVRKAGLPG